MCSVLALSHLVGPEKGEVRGALLRKRYTGIAFGYIRRQLADIPLETEADGVTPVLCFPVAGIGERSDQQDAAQTQEPRD